MKSRAALPLLIPSLAGLAYLGAAGAPTSYLIVNAGAVGVGLGAIAFSRLPRNEHSRLVIAGVLLGLLAMPLLIGPWVDGIARWISLGGVTLHTGFLAVPLLVRIAASEQRGGAWLMLAAILLAFAQPDMATCLALSCAALAIAIGGKHRMIWPVVLLGLAASLGASFAGNLPPQPFIERVLPELWTTYRLGAATLGLALVGGAAALLLSHPMPIAQRWAVLGTMMGFVTAAALGDYPYPLIGYGAASLLGLAIALLAPIDKED